MNEPLSSTKWYCCASFLDKEIDAIHTASNIYWELNSTIINFLEATVDKKLFPTPEDALLSTEVTSFVLVYKDVTSSREKGHPDVFCFGGHVGEKRYNLHLPGLGSDMKMKEFRPKMIHRSQGILLPECKKCGLKYYISVWRKLEEGDGVVEGKDPDCETIKKLFPVWLLEEEGATCALL